MSTSDNNQRIRLVFKPELADEVRDFLIDRQARGLSPKTVAWYSEKLAIALSFFSSHGVDQTIDMRATHVRGFLIELGLTHNPGGVHGIYRALKAFLNWWESELEPKDWSNPMRKVPPPRVEVPPLEPVALDALRAMLATCEPKSFHGERDRAIMMFLLDSGCRRAEFQALNIGNVDIKTGSVLIVRGKGGKSRTTFIGAKTRRALSKYLRCRPKAQDGDPLWVTSQGTRLSYQGLREILRRRARQANVDEPSLHSFRRGFAISALRSGCDLITLQRMLGHTSLAVVSRYLKQVDGDLQAAHEKVGPVDHIL
jgi:site-specific recombinase XerD